MLDPQPPAVERVGLVRDVAGDEHAGDARRQPLIDEHPVLDADARRLGQRGPRRAPTPTTTGRRDLRSVTGDHPLDGVLALEAFDRRLRQELGSVITMDVEVDLPDPRPSTRSSGTDAISIIVTSHPFARAEAAISAPIHPEPTTTSRPPPRAAAIASESAIVRR